MEMQVNLSLVYRSKVHKTIRIVQDDFPGLEGLSEADFKDIVENAAQAMIDTAKGVSMAEVPLPEKVSIDSEETREDATARALKLGSIPTVETVREVYEETLDTPKDSDSPGNKS